MEHEARAERSPRPRPAFRNRTHTLASKFLSPRVGYVLPKKSSVFRYSSEAVPLITWARFAAKSDLAMSPLTTSLLEKKGGQRHWPSRFLHIFYAVKPYRRAALPTII